MHINYQADRLKLIIKFISLIVFLYLNRAGNWLSPPKKIEGKRSKSRRGKEFLDYVQKNTSIVFFKILYLLINVSLCVWVGITRRYEGGWVILARMFGMCLNFNGTFILVLMLKTPLTWLRSTKIGKYIPIDHHIDFHKAVAVVILMQSFLHCVGHLGRYGTFNTFLSLYK